MVLLDKIKGVFRHVSAGKNVNLYTLARNAYPYYFSKQGYTFSPLTVFLSVNNSCNLRCKMCDVGQRNQDSSFYKNLRLDGTYKELDFDRLSILIDEISEYKPKPRVSVTTTEPFLYKRLFEFARLVSMKGMEFQVTTNGYLLNKYFEDIFISGITELCVSIDGKGEVHDDIRGMKGLYASIIQELKRIRERKLRLNLRYPVITIASAISNFNCNNLAELFDDLDDDCYDRAIVTHMNFIDKGMVEEHNRDFLFVGKADVAGLPGETDNYKVDVNELYRQIIYIKRKYPKVYFVPDYSLSGINVFYNEPHRFVRYNRCYIPWFTIEILADGSVIPLTRCIHIKMGSIYENSLWDIWNGEKYQRFRRQLREYKRFPICRRCKGSL